MRKKIVLGILMFPYILYSQNKEDWFVGAEIGINTIISLDNNNSFQGGVLAEYYFANSWSLMGRIKFFKTGTYNNANTGYFKGQVISFPIDAKWNYRISNNFRGNIFVGFAINQETKSEYHYPINEDTNFSKFYGTFNSGIGFDFFINKNIIIYTNYETYLFGNNRDNKTQNFFMISISPNNNLLNVGFKYNLKK